MQEQALQRMTEKFVGRAIYGMQEPGAIEKAIPKTQVVDGEFVDYGWADAVLMAYETDRAMVYEMRVPLVVIYEDRNWRETVAGFLESMAKKVREGKR